MASDAPRPVRIRVDLPNGKVAILHARPGVSSVAQAMDFLREHKQDKSLVAALAERITSALTRAMTPNTNAARLLRGNRDTNSSYREFPLRYDDSVGTSSITDDDVDVDDWEPPSAKAAEGTQEPPPQASDGLVVHVRVDSASGSRDTMLTVMSGDDPIAKVDHFANQHNLSDTKRKMLLDHVLDHIDGTITETVRLNETTTPTATPSVNVAVTLADAPLGRIELRAADGVIEKTEAFVIEHGLSVAQRRHLFAALFVNMERLASSPGPVPVTEYTIAIDATPGDAPVDDLLCDDDLMAMLNVDKVLAFCDHRQLSAQGDQRRRLLEQIHQSRQPAHPVRSPETPDDVQAAEETDRAPCLVIKVDIDGRRTAVQRFELYAGDDVVDKVHEFSRRHVLSTVQQRRLMDRVLHKMVRQEVSGLAKSPVYQASLVDDADDGKDGVGAQHRTGAVLRFADRHGLSQTESCRRRLLDHIATSLRADPSSQAPQTTIVSIEAAASTPRPPRKKRTGPATVFDKLYALRRSSRGAPPTAPPRRSPAQHSRTSSTSSVICDRLYEDGIRFLDLRRQRSMKMQEETEAGGAGDMTFRPQLDPSTTQLIARHHRRGSSFSESRTSPQTQRRMVMYMEERERREMEPCTFRPEVAAKPPADSAVVVQDDNGVAVHERLYRDGVERKRLSVDSNATIVKKPAPADTVSGDFIDRMHNSKVYMDQALETFRKRHEAVDDDGKPLFRPTVASAGGPCRSPDEFVAFQLSWKRPQGAARTRDPAPAPPILSKSASLVKKAVRDRLRLVFSALAHDGHVDASSALRLDDARVPAHLRPLVAAVIGACGTDAPASITFPQFCNEVVRRAKRQGVLSSSIAAAPAPAPTTPDKRAPARPHRPGDRDVFGALYGMAKTYRDRREMLRGRALALETAECTFGEALPQPKPFSVAAANAAAL